jgi:ABC-type glycerol-3-phosphate transport system substrate-binding protein
MRTKQTIHAIAVLLCLAILVGAAALAGCSKSGGPKVMVFMGMSTSKYYSEMKSTVDNLQKKFKGRITFVIVDYDDPKNKNELKKYNVTTNPTTIIFNKEGQIKMQYVGTAREDQLTSDIESVIPGKQTNPSTQPGSVTTPATPYPGSQSSAPGSTAPVAPTQ